MSDYNISLYSEHISNVHEQQTYIFVLNNFMSQHVASALSNALYRTCSPTCLAIESVVLLYADICGLTECKLSFNLLSFSLFVSCINTV